MKSPALTALLTLAFALPTMAEPIVTKARASELDPEAREYPKIDFVFGTDEKPADLQHASVDLDVRDRGELVIWLMGYNSRLFERLNAYGIHAIQPHYANKWFSKVCLENPVGENSRGNMRLEAATGDDYHHEVDIQKPDGMMERARKFLIHLDEKQPRAKWDQFLSRDKSEVLWEKVTMAGSSHGSTTSARFAKHQKVGRVVMLCGPRDNYQVWQSLPSATPTNRYFGFSHVLDGGWSADHYCRSWEMLGLHELGPIVTIENSKPPYENSRRLISDAEVENDKKAHSAVTPGSASPVNEDGEMTYEPVWEYLFTHPIDKVGEPTPMDDSCIKDQR